MTTADFEIVHADAERLPEVEPLWHALDGHHGELLPVAGPARKRSTDKSWARRLPHYRRWLGEGGVLLLAVPPGEQGGDAVGYAMVSLGEGFDGWDGGGPAGTVESLSVDPDWRGRGVGGALLDAVERELARAGITVLIISVLEPNERARKLYEARGMTPFSRTLVGPVRG